MKRVIIFILALVSFNLSFITVSAATNIIPACNSGGSVSNTPVCGDVQAQSGSSGNLVIHLISDVINVLSFIVGAVSVIIIIVSGIRLVTSSGDTNTVAGAKSGITAAVIGIIVVVLAQTIVIFVLDNIK